jgi:hypothetical protein
VSRAGSVQRIIGEFMSEFAKRALEGYSRLRAEIAGPVGHRFIYIEVNKNYAGSVEEWGDNWYEKLPTTGPTPGSIKIGNTPEEALDWWISYNGYKAE